jgi:hypothetical protein
LRPPGARFRAPQGGGKSEIGPPSQDIAILDSLGRRLVIGERDQPAATAIAKRSHAGGGERGAIGIVAAQKKHLVMDERKHRSASEYAMAAEHAPNFDRSPASELIAQITDEFRLEIPRCHFCAVIPAKAGIPADIALLSWIPAFAGMTMRRKRRSS